MSDTPDYRADEWIERIAQRIVATDEVWGSIEPLIEAGEALHDAVRYFAPDDSLTGKWRAALARAAGLEDEEAIRRDAASRAIVNAGLLVSGGFTFVCSRCGKRFPDVATLCNHPCPGPVTRIEAP